MGGSKASEPSFDRQTERKFASLQKEEKRRQEKEEKAQAETEAKLLKLMGNTSAEAEASVRGGDVGRLVKAQAAALKSASDKYTADVAATRLIIEKREPLTRRGKAAAFKRRSAAIERQVARRKRELALMHKYTQTLAGRAAKLAAQLDKSKAHNLKVKEATEKLSKMERKTEFRDDLVKLRDLVLLNEGLKGQETAFKESWAAQRAEWQGKIDAVRAGKKDDVETARLLEIEEMYAEVSSKYNRGRGLLSKKAREIASILRQIDDVPLRSELIQYERRFVELFDQVASKLEENRKYYDTYNNLNEQRELYNKEATLIQSINDNFENAMRSSSLKDSFMKQCGKIATVVQQVNQKKEKTVRQRESQVALTNTALQKLVDKQRKYLKMVAKFQELCNLNEQLSATQKGAA